MEIVIGFIVGFIVNLLTSWIFWRYLHQVKPNVKISPVVAKGVDYQDGREVYRIKVINYGSRQAVNISAECDVMELVSAGGGKKRASKEIPLKVDKLMALGAIKFLGDMWKLTPLWEVTLKPTNPIENEMSDDGRLVMTLSATDGMSGTTIVQRVTYTKQQIMCGEFIAGENI